MLRLRNVRAGFATNSSSSHSVILLPPARIGQVKAIAGRDKNEFGWDFFRLVSEEDKLRYLAAQFFGSYRSDPDALADLVARIDREVDGYAAEMQPVLAADDDVWIDRPNVDHQSAWTLPKPYDPALLDTMIAFFRSPRVAVLGGNDNESSTRNLVNGATSVAFLDRLRDTMGSFRSRRDGPFWTLFDTAHGTKIRFSFDHDDLSADGYTKASTPELIDVKLTGWCAGGCKFCYMGSTTAGQHAPFERIEAIAEMLGKLKVFEVALGGGEPTAHPDFARILQLFHDHGIVPNFTTFSDKWLDDPEIVWTVKTTVGGIGVSCLDAKGLALAERIQQALDDHTIAREVEVSIQHVVGAVPIMQTVDLIEAAFSQRFPVLLLGFKEVGFGEHYHRFDDDALEVFIKLAIGAGDHGWAKLAVDTALLARYPKLPAVLGVPDALVTPREGAFSCYIDATTGQCGASSYERPEAMLPLPMDADEFNALFAGF